MDQRSHSTNPFHVDEIDSQGYEDATITIGRTAMEVTFTDRLVQGWLCFWISVIGCAAPTTDYRSADTADSAAVAVEIRVQENIALQSILSHAKRIDHISYPILKSGAQIFGDRVSRYNGISYANKYTFGNMHKAASIRLFGLEERLKVILVTPGSPADIAGVRVNDVLRSINGESIPSGREANVKFDLLMQRVASDSNTISLGIRRDTQDYDLVVATDVICYYPVYLVDGDEVNAMSDGRKIGISKGMVRYIQNDNEMAQVISHELAHNVLKHHSAVRKNRLTGSIFDIVGGLFGVPTGGLFGLFASKAYSQEFELEADYVGLYLLARAGYDYNAAADFWRRMAAEQPESIKSERTASHPSFPERFIALENTAREIAAKRAAGLPIIPNFIQ